MWFYVNGEFVEEAQATIPILDHGFLYGDGCFEGIATYDGLILHLDDHVARFFRSARALQIEVPIPPHDLRELLIDTARRNGMDQAHAGYLRPIVTRGVGPVGVGFSSKLSNSTLVVIPQVGDRPISFGPTTDIVSAVVTSFTSFNAGSVDPAIKSNNYLPNILAFLEAERQQEDVAILRTQDGGVSEGHGMNLFCIRDGVVYTPPAAFVLRGITRHHVLRIASELGYGGTEAPLTPYDLMCSDEAFVTSSLHGISPIGSINRQPLPSPIPGPVTAELRDTYVRYAIETGVAITASE